MIGLTFGQSFAQNGMNKADAISALDEPTHDINRFERAVALARSLGVSDSRITISRFSQTLFDGNLEAAKRQFAEAEKALATLPANESIDKQSEILQILPKIKKMLESGDHARIQATLEKAQRTTEAKSIAMDLRRIDAAVDQCAIEQRLQIGSPVPKSEWLKKVTPGSRLRDTGADIFGLAYGDQVVDRAPKPNPASAEKVSAHVPANFFDLPSAAKRN
jgi:hypothetical protein